MRSYLLVALMLPVVLGSGQVRAESRATSPDQALIHLDNPSGWTLETALRFDRRAFTFDGETEQNPSPLDLKHARARLGGSPLPWLFLYGELGGTEPETGERSGDFGPVGGVGLRIHAVNYVIDASPVVGPKRMLTLALEGSFHAAEADLDEASMDWTELDVRPYLLYQVNRRGEDRWRPHEPSVYTLRGGVAWNELGGDLDGRDFSADKTFGLVLGTDIRWDSGWVTRLDVTLLGNSDRQVGVAAGYHF